MTVLVCMCANQKIGKNPSRKTTFLPFPAFRVRLKCFSRRNPNRFAEMPVDHDPSLETKLANEVLRTTRCGKQFRKYCSAHYETATICRILKRPLGFFGAILCTSP